MTVYLIKNLLNGKMYVGQTRMTLKARWRSHVTCSYCKLLHHAIVKYGQENFEMTVLYDAVSQSDLDEKEIFFIKALNTLSPFGYNLLSGGSGKSHHPETRKRMSEIRKGRKMTGKAAAGIKRGPRPPEVGMRISEVKKGRPNGLKGLKRPYAPKPERRLPVRAVNLATREESVFSGVAMAAQALKVSRPNIHKVLGGARKSAGGYLWFKLAS